MFGIIFKKAMCVCKLANAPSIRTSYEYANNSKTLANILRTKSKETDNMLDWGLYVYDSTAVAEGSVLLV